MCIRRLPASIWLAIALTCIASAAHADPITLTYDGNITSSMLSELEPGTAASWSATYDPALPTRSIGDQVIYLMMIDALSVGARSLTIANTVPLYTNPLTGLFSAESGLDSAVEAAPAAWTLGARRASHFGWWDGPLHQTAVGELVFCQTDPVTQACGAWGGTVRLSATSVRSAAAVSTASVPEPATCLLVALGALLSIRMFRKPINGDRDV